jgi:hypothetical protein
MKAFAIAILQLAAPYASAAHLTASAAAEFARYAAAVEDRLAREHSSPDTYFARALRIEPVDGGVRPLPGALLHHWRAAAFVPHATPQDMLALLRDYNHLARFYSPEVISSRALTIDGDTASVAIRLNEQKLVTVVLDGEYHVESRLSSPDRGYSVSRSTHIWQIDNPGTPRERRRMEANDDGFLWRLNSYWSFANAPDGSGLWIECEAVSLTRDVPLGLGWLLAPMVEQLPRETLEFTLNATRKALNPEQ